RARQLRQFGGRDRGRDDDEQRGGRQAREEADKDQGPANDLERSHEMRRERGPPEADAGEPHDAHVRVGELQDALGEEDEASGDPDEHDAPWPGRWPQEERRDDLHLTTSFFGGRRRRTVTRDLLALSLG